MINIKEKCTAWIMHKLFAIESNEWAKLIFFSKIVNAGH